MAKEPKNWDGISRYDQILVPVSQDELKAFPLLNLVGSDRCYGVDFSGFGTPPMRIISQRGPFQDGETPLSMRWDSRVAQIVVEESLTNEATYSSRRYDLVDLLRPSRVFLDKPVPFVYRKVLSGGKRQHVGDLETTNGSNVVTSHDARFVHNGLLTSETLTITSGADTGEYTITEVRNDYTLLLNSNMTATATGIQAYYTQCRPIRDLNFITQQGPNFDSVSREDQHYPTGYREVIRLVAQDPFWYGVDQREVWEVQSTVGDLVFDGEGAWFGETSGIGRWLFVEDFVGQSIDIVYWGHEIAYPTITIVGPAVEIVVVNETTGYSISLDYDVDSGDTVVIDTLAQSVRNSAGDELYTYLTGSVDLFALYPPPRAVDRINTISISFSDAEVGVSRGEISWKNKYLVF